MTTETGTAVRDLPPEEAGLVLGPGDSWLRLVCSRLGVQAVYRDGRIVFTGEASAAEKAACVIDRLREDLAASGEVREMTLYKALDFPAPCDSRLELTVPGKAGRVVPKTPGQAEYMKAMRESEVVFSIGPAGTGKTFLAVAAAVGALRDGLVGRIIITRPAVEAGENLGFLPGDLQQKIDPYLKPIYDALNDTLSPARLKRSMENQVIEVAPLAYMRGRTLNDSFVILDEAQNTTLTQLKMFLTRMGFRSRVVVTGDITQIDLRPVTASGLVRIQGILGGVEGIRFVYMSEQDVVRHPLVQRIISAFSKASAEEAGQA
ncbi:PhoH family protein [Candidatus Fermentibacteria bacterium]|nr:PhoH family protein [Candidatus Fermentibacteria bacterium]